ncbi:hypothetical protein C6990_05345 [Nitrosopumilus sp. b3]|uniref:hypothetical protein n=1 Tax=Nitrosopumilus sp. b3 TaxID=2109909 RepID=UPI0015F409CB|nr:hypothetical protein [Nitrosopumilus sp. b3]KAF6247106.1 hypothetical protein C6990_05345 [Nitrosopumilus sp. b3]
MEQLAAWLEDNKNKIPNSEILIHKLRKDQQLGHLVNAEFVKRFHDNGTYKVTDVELSTGNHDIDIELDNKINVQTWHGASVASHNIKRGKVGRLGGVPDDWDKNESVLKKKLGQLPNDKLGVLLLLQSHTGFTFLPEWHRDIIPKNKCVISLHAESWEPFIAGTFPIAEIHINKDFQNMNEAKKIISAIGYNYKATFTFDNGLQWTTK